MGTGASAIPKNQIQDPHLQRFHQLLIDMVSSNSSTKAQAIVDICNICFYEENVRNDMVQSKTDFIPILVKLIRDEKGTNRDNAIRSFLNLTLSAENRTIIGDPIYGYYPVGLAILKSMPITSNEFIFTYRTFNNLALGKRNAQYMLDAKLGFLEFNINMFNVSSNDPENESNSARIFRNMMIHASDSDFDRIFHTKVHVSMTNRLIAAGTNPSTWINRWTGTCYWCLGFLIEFASRAQGAYDMKSIPGCLDYFQKLSRTSDSESFKSAFIVAFMVGKDEGNNGAGSLLQENPQLCENILDVLEDTLACGQGPKSQTLKNKGYSFAVLQLRVIMSALKVLSISDANKSIMVKSSTLLPMILQILHLYVDNQPEVTGKAHGVDHATDTAGGGGYDIITAEQTIELLAQLSFKFDTDEELVKYMTFNYDIPKLLSRILDIGDSRSVSTTCKQQTATLIKRLQLKFTAEIQQPIVNRQQNGHNVSTTHQKTKQHVMLSYAWSANKHLVVELGKELRKLGYDVWRDEDGSTLVPPMSGNIDDVMAEAIQNAYAAIICVSPQYKESVNCRSEAKYCQARVHSANLKLIYVMMDENYHTRSTPTAIDGWLGFMVGTELWYRLWSPEYVVSTAQSIAEIVGNNAKSDGSAIATVAHQHQQHRQQHDDIPAVQSHQNNNVMKVIPTVQTTPTKQKDIEKAWGLISDPKNASDNEGLVAYLEELGISDKADMDYVEKEHVDKMASMLKPIKRAQFLNVMGF